VERIKVLESFPEPRSTTNPYIHLLAAALRSTPSIELQTFSWRTALRGDFDVFHLHWSDPLLAGRTPVSRLGKRIAMALFLTRLRTRRTPVVRTRHNVKPHEGSLVAMWVERRFDRLTTASIVLNDASAAIPPATVIRHGHYRDWFEPYARTDRVPGRLAFVGLIRPYKGVEGLIEAYGELAASHPDVSLSISGRPRTEKLGAAIASAVEDLPGVDVSLEYVDDATFVRAVTASSLVVLPYRSMENSGAALAALSLDRPVLVPRNPVTEALREEVGGEWVQLFDGDLTARDLDAALTSAALVQGSPEFIDRDWGDVGDRHHRVFTAARTQLPQRQGMRKDTA